MKKIMIIKQIFTFLFLSLTINSFSQINDISMENIQYLGSSISECSTINFNSSNNHSITFDAKVEVEDTPNGFDHTSGNLKIAYYTGSAQEVYQTILVDGGDWIYDAPNTNAYLNIPITMELNNNDFDAGDTEGGSIYIIYTDTTNNFFKDSCDVAITKPRFTFTPNDVTLTCDNNSPKTFTVNNENNSPGNLLYQWNVGSGWLLNGNVVSSFTTTDDNVQLTPTIFPPSNVTVTPKLDNVNFPLLTSVITLGDFTSSNVITGDNTVCSSENFNVFGLASVTSVTSWSIDNTNIASISSNGNQVTVTPTGNGVINITATLTNSCGQTFDIFKNNVAIGAPAITNYTINGGNDNVSINSTSQLNVDFVPGATSYYWFITVQNSDCPSGGVLPSFQTGNGNSSTLTSTSRYAFIDWGTCTGNFIVNCRALNNCGASDIGYKLVNVFNANGGGGNPCLDGPVENRQAITKTIRSKIKDIKIFPNPYSGGTIQFKLPPALPCDDSNGFRSSINNVINIYDFKGRKLFAQAYNTNDISIKSLDLKKGHYIIKVYTNNGEVLNSKLVIE